MNDWSRDASAAALADAVNGGRAPAVCCELPSGQVSHACLLSFFFLSSLRIALRFRGRGLASSILSEGGKWVYCCGGIDWVRGC